MFITGPDVIETVTGEEVSFEELGGAVTHSSTSGVAHFAEESEEDALDDIARLLSYLPANNVEDPPRVEPWDDPERTDDELGDIVPDAPRKPYDMKDVIGSVVDEGSFFEVQENFAKNIVVGLPGSTATRSGSSPTTPRERGHARHRVEPEGRPIRPLLRRVQHPHPHLRGRARVHAGNRSGAQRDHPPRCEVAVRLLGGDGSPPDRHHPKGVRRSLLRDVVEAYRRRRELRVADRRRSRW